MTELLDKIIGELIKILPFPVIIMIAIICIVTKILKEFKGYANYSKVFRDRIFIGVTTIVIIFGISWYVIQIYSPSNDNRIDLKGKLFVDGYPSKKADIYLHVDNKEFSAITDVFESR